MMLKCPVCGAHVPEEAAVELPTAKGPERYCSLRCGMSSETERERAAGVAGAAAPAAHVLPPPPRAIVVAVDGSGPSLRAVEFAASIAKVTGGRLTLIHAIDPALMRLLPLDSAFAGATRLGLDVAEMERTLRDDAVRQLERCGRICESAGVPYTSRVAMEQPTRAIADAAEKADLVVMGSRGLGAFSGAALGSLSHRVIGGTGKPVLVVH
jgi:nucleotide-binding universal stress UspA family protein